MSKQLTRRRLRRTTPLRGSLLLMSFLLLALAACGPEGDGNGTGDGGTNNDTPDMMEDMEQPDIMEDMSDEEDMDTPDVPVEGEVVICDESPADTGASCQTTPGGASLVLRGNVLGPLSTYVGGQVVVDGSGQITCVGCDCADAPGAFGATEVNCGQNIISPGLINTHEHITFAQNAPGDWGDERFEHRHDWRRGQRGHSEINVSGGASDAEIAWGELRHVMSGVTSIAGSGETMGFLRNVDRDDLGGPANLDTFPLGDSRGTQITGSCDYPGQPSQSDLNAGAYVPHVAEGIDAEARNEFLCLSSSQSGGIDVAAQNSTFIHGVGLLPVDGDEMASSGTAISWAPRSNISLYGNTAPVTMLDNQGVLISLGTDWTASGSVNMLRELQCADFLNQNYYNNHFSNRDLWKMATANAAEALGVQDSVGALTPGRLADLAIYTHKGGEDFFRDILDGGVGDTILVLRGGEPLYGDTDVVSAMVGGDNCDALGSVCGAQRSVCTQREIGMPFDNLAQQNQGSYDLFFCDTPRGEPTCTPLRPDEYTGQISADDMDGDGIANAQDNCPAVFNPVRPLDMGQQGDADGDGAGDACDPCPLDADTQDCGRPDPADSDGDGVATLMDNCPEDANADQADADMDGKGDVCDVCPDEPNPGAAGCQVEISEIKQGVVPQNSAVRINGVVTGVSWPRFFLQEEGGGEYSGIFVFISDIRDVDTDVTGLEPGDRVSLDGRVGEYFGQIQVSDVTSLEVTGSGDAPSPAEVTAAQVGGEGGAAYEGVLITVTGSVTDVDLAPGAGDSAPTNEVELDGALRVNDYFFQPDPTLEIGDEVRLVGLLRFANENYKLEPRGQEDVIILDGAPPQLRDLSPSDAQVELDGTLTLNLRLTRPAPEGGSVVTLDNSAPGRLQAPATVTVPEGAREASFDVTGLEIGEEPVVLTATLNDGQSFTARLTVVEEITIPDTGLVISEVFYNPDGSDDGKEWIEIFNGTTAPLDLSNFSLGSGGRDYTNSVIQLEGTLAPGGCFVVGGPTSAADNGAPEFDQVFDFTPDIQNSGSDADAVALFNVGADQIQSSTVPVDAVIYGGSNSNSLLDESGDAGEVDVEDAGSGNSIERTSSGWRVQTSPTPGDCGALQ